MKDHGGVVGELVRGEWVEPSTGKRCGIPIDNIVIRETLDGAEAELVSALHAGQSLTVVSDPFTHDALGRRIFDALRKDGADVREFVWQTPSCSDRGVEEVRAGTRGRDALIAVGSGTVSDTVKYACWLDDRRYSVFPTSPMNAYTTSTASVAFDGFKQSITTRAAKGVFFDLDTLVRCPPRLISAAFADVICRTTAQVDWLLSHLLFETDYVDTPYALLAIDEAEMMRRSPDLLTGDFEALAMLTRVAAIMGLGTTFTDTTHSGSMHEHMISHYIDMFAGERHPRSSHGEQVGVTTITMSQLQNDMLSSETAPVLEPTTLPEDWLREHFEPAAVDTMIAQTRAKAIDGATALRLNRKLDDEWPILREKLTDTLVPFEQLDTAMQGAGCQRTAGDLGLDADFYREAVSNARWIRDRFGMLDMAGDSGRLASFVTGLPT